MASPSSPSIWRSKTVWMSVASTILVILGTASYLGLGSLVKKVVYSRMVLAEGSESFPFWKDIPVPIIERFYFFNITNPHEIERSGAKPKLREVGPFTYRLFLNKTDIVFHDNGTVTFKEKKTWVFLPDQSSFPEDTVIVTLNVPLAMTLTLLQSASSAVRVIVNLALEALTEGFFIRRTVKQLTFEGYPDTLTSFAPLLNPQSPYRNGRFAWFNSKNGSADGIYNIFTGKRDIAKYAIVDRFNNKSKLPYWLSDECNNLDDSTNGELRPPLNLRGKWPSKVKLFHPDLCRILHLDYNKSFTLSDTEGVTAVRYTLSPTTYKNSIDYPPNACYDTKYVRPASLATSLASPRSEDAPISRLQSFLTAIRRADPTPVSTTLLGRENPNALPTPASQVIKYASGVFDISKCKYGVPLFVSAPHFMGANDYYRSVVDGMRPNSTKHSFFMDIEPNTGSTVGLAARVQINVAINKGHSGIRYRNIPNIVFPAFWQEVTMSTIPSVNERLWMATHMPIIIASVSSYSFFALGAILSITTITLLVVKVIRHVINGDSSDVSSSGSSKGSSTNKGHHKDDNRNVLDRQGSSSTQHSIIDGEERGIDNPIPAVVITADEKYIR